MSNKKQKTNVIQFPKETVLPVSLDDAEYKISEIRDLYASDASDYLMDVIVEVTNSYGFFRTPNEASKKDLTIIREFIKGSMLRDSGVEHPMQQIADSIKFIDESDPKK